MTKALAGKMAQESGGSDHEDEKHGISNAEAHGRDYTG
jgi:hypothetical protein